MRFLAPLALAALALTACAAPTAPTAGQAASSGRPGAAAKQDASYFAHAGAGTTWRYAVKSHYLDDPDREYTGTVETRVERAERRGGEAVLQLRETCDYTHKVRFPELVETSAGVTLTGVDYLGPTGSEADGHRLAFLAFPLSVGARWDDGQFIGKVKGPATVETPAGRFQATRVDVIGTLGAAYTAVGAYYLAPGVGIVQSELTAYGQAFETKLVSLSRKP